MAPRAPGLMCRFYGGYPHARRPALAPPPPLPGVPHDKVLCALHDTTLRLLPFRGDGKGESSEKVHGGIQALPKRYRRNRCFSAPRHRARWSCARPRKLVRDTSNTCAMTNRTNVTRRSTRITGWKRRVESGRWGWRVRALGICSTTGPSASLDARTTENMPPHSP